ncbi:hypothetical protein ACFVS9_30230 [Streptomyces sp. NPDC058008]|uniref:hypothetical protein n=1 Tax=Streptomyces sp. NPDC058008 TaxID=3346303 RepID=UPI0036E97D85
MARHQPNHRLALLLTEADWNPAELARAVNALGKAQGMSLRYDRTSVAHWLTGSRPRPPVPDLVAAAFSRRTERLVTAEETGLISPGRAADDQALPPGTETDDAAGRLTILARTDADPARRSQLTGGVYSLRAVDSPGWNPERPVPVRPRSPHSRVTAEEVRALREMCQIFADLMERHGGGHARSALAAYLTDDTSRLLAARADSSLRGQLFSCAAQLTHILARMTMDAGYPSLAQRYFTTALGLAQEAGDSRVYAITLRAMSLQALRLGFLKKAAQLADSAMGAGPVADPSTLAFLLSQRAVTHAHARQGRRAVADLAAAESHHDRVTRGAGPFDSYPRAGLDYQRGQVLLALGDREGAARSFASSAAARGDDRRRSAALTHARLAATLLSLGRPEESCVHWNAFLDGYPGLRLAPADEALVYLRRSLYRYRGLSPVAVVLHRARSVTRTAPAPAKGHRPGPGR